MAMIEYFFILAHNYHNAADTMNILLEQPMQKFLIAWSCTVFNLSLHIVLSKTFHCYEDYLNLLITLLSLNACSKWHLHWSYFRLYVPLVYKMIYVFNIQHDAEEA